VARGLAFAKNRGTLFAVRALLVAAAAALVLVPAASAAPAKAGCPAAWRSGWQALANKIQAPVYCPSWMPSPLDAKIRGDFIDIDSVHKDRSYLISFLEHGDVGSGDVHVNFRGYPGTTKIPRCATIILNGKKTIRGTTPCFAQSVGTVTERGINATMYSVNQDADQWHVLLAWRFHGGLYAVSQHRIGQYTYAQVVKNLKRLLAGLVLVQPQG
jgi:hypothetical protein